jgi:hypothetical protein
MTAGASVEILPLVPAEVELFPAELGKIWALGEAEFNLNFLVKQGWRGDEYRVR